MQQFNGVIMNFANKPKTTLRQRLAARTLGAALLSVAAPVALLAPNAVYAAPASEAAAAKSLSQQLSGIKSMTANFVQTTSGATSAQKMRSIAANALWVPCRCNAQINSAGTPKATPSS
ncbi:hypothetical protein [Faucicola atlantae]|uniref:hypothetical protein n=1 Tax=Faucicola atlantae TaxID=34059 RepID=UPI00338FFD05